MPELPEVETMCRGLRPTVGYRVAEVQRVACRRRPISIRPRLDQFRRRTEGKTIVAIDRAGKRVVIWLAIKLPQAQKNSRKAQGLQSLGLNGKHDQPISKAAAPGDEAIVIEPRMTGLVLLSDPPTAEHLRFRLHLTAPQGGAVRNRQVLFWDRRGLGLIHLFSAPEFATRFSGDSKTLGPDALQITAEHLRQRLHTSRREIKVALLDQRAVAGIGNLYASEILYRAKVHPATQCLRLRAGQWERLHTAMLEILHEAIRYEGSTLADGTYRNTLNESGAYQNEHRVYDRADQPCRVCQRPIRRIVQAQRSTFFCPSCQKR